MKINYATLRHPSFNQVLTKVLHTPMPLKDSKRLLDLTFKIREEQVKADELAAILKEKHQGDDLTEDSKAVKEYLETCVDFDFEPLDFESLGDLKISASELLLLEGIIK